ncbi:MAG: glutaredoxin family protein [Gaiellales bacterium]|nr:MAG: glutaredoxin family protein [Gaiellales bacterium]
MCIPWEHVPGSPIDHDVRLFALSTCGWCRRTKQLLEELGVEYYRVDVDLLDSGVKDEVVAEVKKWNSAATFPTIVIDNQKAIIGYEAEEIREKLS